MAKLFHWPVAAIPKAATGWVRSLSLVLVLLLVLGMALRWVNLSQKFYWVDEVHTSTRIAGYTKSQVEPQIFDQGLIPGPELRQYQVPAALRGWGDTLKALQQHPEHPPLYYLLGRIWLGGWLTYSVDWVSGLRSLSVIISLVALPAAYWLCRELGMSRWTGLVAIALVSLSPLHILYAQEAREYSLWTVATLLSSAALLRSLRLREGPNPLLAWGLYGLTLVLGFYSHLLFGLVAIAHGLYVLLLRYSRKTALAWALALTGSLLAFLPWMIVLVNYLAQVLRAVDATQRGVDLSYLINTWLRNLSRVFFSTDLGTANLLVTALAFVALYTLWRQTPRRTWGLILLLIACTSLPLMVGDGLTGSISSTRIRYLIPAYVGLQLAIAHLMVHTITTTARRSRVLWGTVFGLVFLGMTLASGLDAGSTTNWTKSDKAVYYEAMAQAINATDRPLIVSDSSATYILALNRLLEKDTQFTLTTQPRALTLPEGFNDIFIFDPSPRLQNALRKQQDYTLEVVVEQNRQFQLLRASRPPISD